MNVREGLKPPSGPPPGKPGYSVYAISADDAIRAFKLTPDKVMVNGNTSFHKYRWQTSRWNDGHKISDADPPIAFRNKNGFVQVDGERWYNEGRNPADILKVDEPSPAASPTVAGGAGATPAAPGGAGRPTPVDPIGATAPVPVAPAQAPVDPIGATAPAPAAPAPVDRSKATAEISVTDPSGVGSGTPTTTPGTFPAKPPAGTTGPQTTGGGGTARGMARAEGEAEAPAKAPGKATGAPAKGASDEILPGGVFVKSDDFSISVHSNADPNAYVRFEVEGKTVKMTDAYRKDLPEGSGKLLVAEGLRRIKVGPGTELILHNVVNEPSKQAHAAGAGPRDVLVARMTLRALERLGLAPTAVRWETIRGKLCIVMNL